MWGTSRQIISDFPRNSKYIYTLSNNWSETGWPVLVSTESTGLNATRSTSQTPIRIRWWIPTPSVNVALASAAAWTWWWGLGGRGGGDTRGPSYGNPGLLGTGNVAIMVTKSTMFDATCIAPKSSMNISPRILTPAVFHTFVTTTAWRPC